ncbi:uncharacterized protein [Euphorbia lathyris]|uniref:uncharacterized protein n=1 Tax=Euphorbia lathyris TaxID=212925 RepID=UPI00331427A2
MGKSNSFTGNLQEVARIVTSHHHSPKPKKPREVRVESAALKLKKMEESSLFLDGRNRVPLSQVVSECLKRWFQDTLREAKAGDIAMQVLVGQMYFNGYGVSKDSQKGLAWHNRASKSRASVWKVSDKRPGYNASDSDSDETKDDETKIR